MYIVCDFHTCTICTVHVHVMHVVVSWFLQCMGYVPHLRGQIEIETESEN